MKRHLLTTFVCGGSALALLLAATPASAVKLFSATDNILAIDTSTNSSFPAGENPGNAVDQVVGPPTTKYLNFGKAQTGFIVTPAASSIVQSLQLRAANDVPNRDPMTYELYGTNDAITSISNSNGFEENWSLISSGDSGLTVDPGRNNLGAIQDIVGNATSYSSYKVVFPTLRDAALVNSMQVADVQFFTAPAGGGSAILASGNPTVAITHDTVSSASSYPGGENPTLAFDGLSSNKYLNFGREYSGVIVSRADGKASIVESLTFTTAPSGGEQNRDPLTWTLFGTDDPITSTDNSRGNLENWIEVDSGVTGFATDPGRGVMGAVQLVDNDTAYGAYRLVFTSLRVGGELMQIGDILIDGQVVPEPSTFVMVGMAVTAFGLVARRRNTRSA